MIDFGKNLYVSFNLKDQSLTIHDKLQQGHIIHFNTYAIKRWCDLELAYFIQRNRRKKKAEFQVIESSYLSKTLNAIKCQVNEDSSIDFIQNETVIHIPSRNWLKLDRLFDEIIDNLRIVRYCKCC